MHGLVFETSICYWQDQPDRRRPPFATPGEPSTRTPKEPTRRRLEIPVSFAWHRMTDRRRYGVSGPGRYHDGQAD